MSKLRKIRDLSWLERWVLVRAAVLLIVAEVSLRLLPIQSLLKWMPNGEARRQPASLPDPERIAWLVEVAARHSLLRGRLRPTCLRKSLVLCALLRNRGVEARLVIGTNVSRNFGPQENFRAHSWVIAEGKVLLAGGADGVCRAGCLRKRCVREANRVEANSVSGIAAIYNLDGRPAEASLLRRMTAAVAHRGPDGIRHWVDGAVAIGHCMLHTTPESLLEQQPLTDESRKLCLTFDGRVDNRADLRRALESKGARLRDDTDAELVLRAYECWEENCPKEILGDFALAIWDGRKRHLFCARDIMGIKPLYYYSNARTVLIASELRQLLEHPAVPQQPNEEMIADCLAAMDLNLEGTLYEGIHQLPRAHSLTVQRGGIQNRSYWDLNGIPDIRYRDDREYADHFYEIFQEAVRCRLRSHRMVGSELSGGLDSSSVVSTAQQLLSRGSKECPDFETFSVLFPGRPCDESPYMQEVVKKTGVKSNALVEGPPQANYFAQQVYRYRDFPYFPTGQTFEPVMVRMQEKGARVLLTGDGGDQWLIGSPFHAADLLRSLRMRDAIRQCRMESQILTPYGTRRSPLHVLARYGVWPLLPGFARTAIRTAFRRDGGGQNHWITSEFSRRTRLAERQREREVLGPQSATIALKEDIRFRLDYPWYSLIDRYISEFGLEYRHPFMDRRVIEYCLALPQAQFRRDGQAKFLLRQAMTGILPEGVRTRVTKGLYGTHTYLNAMQALGGERFFGSLEIGSLGWVDSTRVQKMYQHFVTNLDRNDVSYTKYLSPLWAVSSIELWFKTVFLNGGVPTQSRTTTSVNTQEMENQPWEKHQTADVN